MVKLALKNVSEIEDEMNKHRFVEICEEKKNYIEEVFKNYDKDLVFEIILDKSGKTYKISASLNLKSKKLLVAEEDHDLFKAFDRLFNEFKKLMKRQKELERKDYLYKRKR